MHIFIHSSTVEGLRSHTVLISIRLKDAKDAAIEVNSSLDHAIKFYQSQFEKEDEVMKQRLMADYNAFKQYYALYHSGLIDPALKKYEDGQVSLYNDLYLERVFKEILAFDLSQFYQRFNTQICEKLIIKGKLDLKKGLFTSIQTYLCPNSPIDSFNNNYKYFSF